MWIRRYLIISSDTLCVKKSHIYIGRKQKFSKIVDVTTIYFFVETPNFEIFPKKIIKIRKLI